MAHAAQAGIEVIALTDHDSIDGQAELQQAAQAAGLHSISGVELSVRWEKRTLHVVGLGMDPDHASLTQALQRLQQARQRRSEEIARKCHALGLESALEEAAALADGGQITRTHFARLLLSKGKVKDLKQAFKRYLGAGKPLYVAGEWLGLEEAIGAIHDSGGVAVLAHPLRYGFAGAWRERMYTAFVGAGGVGLEVSAGASQGPDELALVAAEAQRHGLLGSVGSDFHGLEQRWLRYGRLRPLPPGVQPVWEARPQLLR